MQEINSPNVINPKIYFTNEAGSYIIVGPDDTTKSRQKGNVVFKQQGQKGNVVVKQQGNVTRKRKRKRDPQEEKKEQSALK